MNSIFQSKIKKLFISFIPKHDHTDFIFSPTPIIFSEEQLRQEVEKSLEDIPDVVISKFNEEEWECHITNVMSIEHMYGYNYKVLGVTDFAKKKIIIYATIDALYYSLPHELGHFLDYSLGTITNCGKWINIHKQDSFSWKRAVANEAREEFFPEVDDKREYFADAFLLYCRDKGKLRYTMDTFNVIDKAILALPFCQEAHSIII